MKRSLIYIWSAFFCMVGSFYLTWRLEEINVQITSKRVLVYIIFIIVLGLICVLKYFHFKEPDLTVKQKLVKIIIAIIMTVFIFIIGFDFFIGRYQPAHITLTAIGESSKTHIDQNGNEVWITSITLNGHKYDLLNIPIIEGWVRKEGNLVYYQNKPSTLEFDLPVAEKIEINMISNSWSGEVVIESSEGSQQIDLFKSDDSEVVTAVLAGQQRHLYGWDLLAIVSGFIFFVLFIDAYIYVVLINLRKVYNYNKWIFIVLIAILITRYLYFKTNQIAYLYPDSIGYINFDFNKILHLNFSEGRVPVYPIFIRLCKFYFGNASYLIYVCYFQMVISFVATIYFYKSLKLITNQKWLLNIFTFLFGSSNTFCGFDYVILTESLALSGVIFYVYFLLIYLKKNNIKYAIRAVLLTLLLSFLRPSFLLFLAITFVFLIVRLLITKDSEITKALKINLFSWIVILIYSFLFFNSTGIFTISDPMPRQLLIVCMNREYFIDGDDKEYVEFVKSGLEENPSDVWPTVMKAVPKFGLKRTQNYAKNCIKKNLSKYIKDEVKESAVNANYDFFSYNIAEENLNPNISTLRNLAIGFFDILKPIHALALATYFLIITIKGLVYEKKMYWLSCGFSSFIILIFISSMIATCSEYIRTMIHMYPFIYFGFVYFIDRVVYKRDYFVDK